MIKPTIHLNGTSPDQLREDIEEALEAITIANQKLSVTQPHERDYYPQGPLAYKKALVQHTVRMQKLLDIRRELFELLEDL